MGNVSNTSTACDDIGEEFNPLKEEDSMGNPNTFQDPKYGRLPEFTFASGTHEYESTTPVNFLAQLEGRHSIIGRSIALYDAANEGSGPIVCCALFVDKTPDGFSPQVPTIASQSNIQHYSSYSHNVAVPNQGSVAPAPMAADQGYTISINGS